MLKIATLFSGIGAVEFAIKRLNIPHVVKFACDNGERELDIDYPKHFEKIKQLNGAKEKQQYVDNLYASLTKKKNYMQESYLANYVIENDMFFQDVCLLDGTDFRNEVDLLVGGSPCQSFSSVGDEAGLSDTRGTLFYEFARLVDEIHPKVFIYENVRNMLNHDKGNTWEVIKGVFDKLNYDIAFNVLNASDYGIPQTRRRLFVIGIRKDIPHEKFEFPLPQELKFTAQDFLLDNCEFGGMESINGVICFNGKRGVADEKYFLSPKLLAYVTNTGTKTFYAKPVTDLPVARTLLKTMGNRHRAAIDNYYTVDGKLRMLSEREALRLMGFTDNFSQVVSRAQMYKQAGNSIVVDVMMMLLESINKAIKIF